MAVSAEGGARTWVRYVLRHERRRRDINQVVREAEVRASNQIIYGWTGATGCTVRQATLHSQIVYDWIGAEGCTVRQATLHSGKHSAARNSPCAAARQNVLTAAKLARLGALSFSAISTINSSGRDPIAPGS